MSACLSREVLQRLLHDESQSYPPEFAAHLTECESCRQRLFDTVGADDWPTAPITLLGNQKHLSGLIARIAAIDPSSDVAVTLPAAPGEFLGLEGSRLGHYDIVKPIGCGGFAVVYLAIDSNLDRQVALKVPTSLSLTRPEAYTRFRREAQAAALLSHPQIVPVYETGQIDATSYIAFEYVDGKDLATWFRGQGGPVEPRQAAEILCALADAVQHAHQRGIVHRDLKPSNVLLTAGEPSTSDSESVAQRLRITDFGLALRTLSEDQTLTAEGTVLGTPAYMSPEQAASSPNIDFCTDIYSLGVMLYELLCGTVPIRKETQLATLKALETEQPPKLRSVRGNIPADLEAICTKCLQKRPDDRYKSAFALAEDLREWLEGRPISARPIPVWQRVSRWAVRNKTVATAATIAFASLLVGLSAAMISASKERIAKQQAEARLSQFQNGMKILTGIFHDLNIREVEQTAEPLEAVLATRLVAAGDDLDADAIGDPLVVADLQLELAASLIALGFADDALNLAESSSEILKQFLTADHPHTLNAQFVLATALIDTGQLREGLQLHQDVLEQRKKVLKEDDPDLLVSMNSVAYALAESGELDEAVLLYEVTLQKKQSIHGPTDPSTLASMHNLASGYLGTGHLDKAMVLFEETYHLRAEKLTELHPDTLTSADQLANCWVADGQAERGLELLKEILRMRETELGKNHPSTLTSMSGLASAYKATGDLDTALPLFETVLELRRGKLGDDHPSTLGSMNNLAVTYEKLGQADLAKPLIDEAYRVIKTKLNDNHPSTLTLLSNVAGISYRLKDYDKAISLMKDVFHRTDAKLGPTHPDTISRASFLRAVYLNTGHYLEAVEPCQWMVEHYRSTLGNDDPKTLEALAYLGTSYLWSGQAATSIQYLEEALAIEDKVPDWEYYRDELRTAYADTGKKDKFLAIAETDMMRYQELPKDSPQRMKKLGILAECYLAIGEFEVAKALLVESLEIDNQIGEEGWGRHFRRSQLGEAMFRLNDKSAAEPLLLGGYEGLVAMQDSIHASLRKIRLEKALDRLIAFYTTQGNRKQVERFEREKVALDAALGN